MAEWLVEEGIGEERAILLDRGTCVAARLNWPGELATGLVAEAVLVHRPKGSSRGTARFAGGELALVDRLPASAAEGAPLLIEVTRPAMGEGGRRKLARARPAQGTPPRAAPSLAESLTAAGHSVTLVRRFPDGHWADLLAEAQAMQCAFPGGNLLFSPVPAMLLVDIDGTLPARELALAAVGPVAAALRRFDVGGNIGIDFPSLPGKDDRRAVDEALGAALAGWPHERTAMNGFGFVQLVARLERPSLLHRAAFAPARLAALALLRRAEGVEGAGAIELSANPALLPHMPGQLIAELARRTGREVRLRPDPALAVEAPHAQLVPR